MLEEVVAGYRQRAKECRERSGQANAPGDRYQQIAEDWEALAVRAETGDAPKPAQPVMRFGSP